MADGPDCGDSDSMSPVRLVRTNPADYRYVKRLQLNVLLLLCVLTTFVHEAMSHKLSLLSTDEWRSYRRLKAEYPHKVLRHTAGEYVHGNIHTNIIEGFWSTFKRGIVGSSIK